MCEAAGMIAAKTLKNKTRMKTKSSSWEKETADM